MSFRLVILKGLTLQLWGSLLTHLESIQFAGLTALKLIIFSPLIDDFMGKAVKST